MTDEVKSTSRRTLVIGAAVMAAAPLVLPAVAQAGVVTQANAKYQTSPKNGNHCSMCNYFIPGAKAGGPGTCKQVAGVISPNGWCMFFAKKPGAT